MLNNPFYYFGAFYANSVSFSAINKARGKQQASRTEEFLSHGSGHEEAHTLSGGSWGWVACLQPGALPSAFGAPKVNVGSVGGTVWQSVRAGIAPPSERCPKVTRTGGTPGVGGTAQSCKGHRETRMAAHSGDI